VDLPTVEEILGAADTRWQPGDAFLAGGSWLFSEPQPGVRRLLDLQSYGWPSLVHDGSGLEIAATCTLAELAAWPVPPQWPAAALFGQCCDALLGSFKIWHVATVGGNICLALPAGPMTAVVAALDGVCTLWAADGTATTRPVSEVVVAPGRTALAAGQLLRSVRLPASALRSRVAFRQASLSAFGRSAALVIGRVAPSGGETVFTVTASTQRPVQLRYAASPPPDDLAHDIDVSVDAWQDDVHGSPAWRQATTHRLLHEVATELAS
jgi:CO/xanthine dehydrogenase FAD-binding subunit